MTDQATTLTPDQRAANVDTNRAANQANAVTAIYGISGAGKSGLADTAAEFAWEEHRAVTLCYAADLGGFGNKRLSLIHAGIVRVYDPQNHVNPFDTMELISLGAWPERLIDPERGFAAPDVKLILPRRIVYVVSCPQGHEVARLDDQLQINSLSILCPVCSTLTAAGNASKIEQVLVRHPMFKSVGLRIYDSFTALGEWGMADLADQVAKGTLPSGLLGAADSLRSGDRVWGSSSEGQYGFAQQRVYGWIRNIRTIPDQVVPAIATFHTEMSKESKRGGGDLHYGPKIPGQAGTSEMPKKLGNLVHAVREQFSVDDTRLVFRLYLRNHINPNDPMKIPYVAKHRGTPLDMPEYLEDAPGTEPWSGFSLKRLFRLLQDQLVKLDAQRKVEYADASHTMWTGEDPGEPDEIVGTVAATAAGAAGAVRISGGGASRLRRAASPAAPVPAPIQTAASVTAAAQGQVSSAAVSTPVVPIAPAPPIQQTATVSPSVPVAQGPVAVPGVPPGPTALSVPVPPMSSLPVVVQAQQPSPSTVQPPVAAAPVVSSSRSRLRAARPPTA